MDREERLAQIRAEQEIERKMFDERHERERRKARADRRAMPISIMASLVGLLTPAFILGAVSEIHVLYLPVTGTLISILALFLFIAAGIKAHDLAVRYYERNDRGR